MNDHTIRRMYTERAPGDIKYICMNDLNTTQELSYYQKNKAKIQASYQRRREKCLSTAKACYEKKKEHYQASMKRYYKENKPKVRLAAKAWDEANKEKIRQTNKDWADRNRDAVRAYQRAYRERNKEQIQQLERKYAKENAYKYKLVQSLRSRVRSAMIRANTKRAGSVEELLGCSIAEARTYIEKQFVDGMSWDNYRRDVWHIDHIRPCASFELTDPVQQRECFHYSNLRPLWAADNITKSSYYGGVKHYYN
jgi:hypothetical protein